MLEPAQHIDRLAHAVVGAALDVHRCLGPGFLESVYEEALCVELTARRIRFARQYPVAVNYKGHAVGECRLDLLVSDLLIVELKAVDALAPIHQAQLMSYLKATDLQLGLLITFNVPVLKQGIKRVVLTDKTPRISRTQLNSPWRHGVLAVQSIYFTCEAYWRFT